MYETRVPLRPPRPLQLVRKAGGHAYIAHTLMIESSVLFWGEERVQLTEAARKVLDRVSKHDHEERLADALSKTTHKLRRTKKKLGGATSLAVRPVFAQLLAGSWSFFVYLCQPLFIPFSHCLFYLSLGHTLSLKL